VVKDEVQVVGERAGAMVEDEEALRYKRWVRKKRTVGGPTWQSRRDVKGGELSGDCPFLASSDGWEGFRWSCRRESNS
jgi:hypothetical protein